MMNMKPGNEQSMTWSYILTSASSPPCSGAWYVGQSSCCATPERVVSGSPLQAGVVRVTASPMWPWALSSKLKVMRSENRWCRLPHSTEQQPAGVLGTDVVVSSAAGRSVKG